MHNSIDMSTHMYAHMYRFSLWVCLLLLNKCSIWEHYHNHALTIGDDESNYLECMIGFATLIECVTGVPKNKLPFLDDEALRGKVLGPRTHNRTDNYDYHGYD